MKLSAWQNGHLYIICIREDFPVLHTKLFTTQLVPDEINSLFTKHETSYNLRDNLKFDLKCSKSKALHDSFTHRASIVWNCLPSQLKSKPSYSSFKASIETFSKYIDQINFGTNSTATNTNSDEFMYY